MISVGSMMGLSGLRNGAVHLIRWRLQQVI